jgi:LacI family transcriptional regulator
MGLRYLRSSANVCCGDNSGTLKAPRRRISVKDVAAKSGVSFPTTSKVLNGKGSVSELTRARILRVAAELGYVPNLQARSLVMQSTRAVGVISSDFSDHNLSRFLVGAEQEARRQGYSVLITSIESDGSGGASALRALMERRVDGVLLAAPLMEDDPTAMRSFDRSVPVVSLHHVPGGGVATVGSDHELTGFLATDHLIARGHRRIATVIGARGRRVTQSRLHGYRRALERARITFDPELVEDGNWAITGAELAVEKLLERCADLTAISVQNDIMAIGVLSALRRLGKRVPEEVAVVGCDDIDQAAYTVPPLTTVHVPFFETGERAMQLLLTMIAAGAPTPRKLLLPVWLVVRASSGRPT